MRRWVVGALLVLPEGEEVSKNLHGVMKIAQPVDDQNARLLEDERRAPAG